MLITIRIRTIPTLRHFNSSHIPILNNLTLIQIILKVFYHINQILSIHPIPHLLKNFQYILSADPFALFGNIQSLIQLIMMRFFLVLVQQNPHQKIHKFLFSIIFLQQNILTNSLRQSIEFIKLLLYHILLFLKTIDLYILVVIDRFDDLNNSIALNSPYGRVEVIFDRILCSSREIFAHRRPRGEMCLERLEN